MCLAGTKEYAAFGGQIVFHMLSKRALRMSVVNDELRRAMPAVFEGAASEAMLHILRFIGCFGLTWDIEFNLTDDSPDDLRVFKSWYTGIVPKTDYRRAYEAYLACASEDIERAWSEALEATRPPAPSAPAELTAQEGEADADPDFLLAATVSVAG